MQDEDIGEVLFELSEDSLDQVSGGAGSQMDPNGGYGGGTMDPNGKPGG